MSGETIFSVATGVGPQAIAVIRVSGNATPAVLAAIAGEGLEPRRAHLRTLRHPLSRTVLDRALVLSFPAPASYTGEDCAEFHCHGGLAVVAGVLEAIATVSGCRPAQPGEFSRRAFDNGRMDLSELEGLADLIDAESASQRDAALRQYGGALRRDADALRARLLEAQALLEASIDFADEGDVPPAPDPRIAKTLRSAREAVRGQLDGGRIRERLRAGVTVVIAGAPNVGKSTLLNWFAGREAAIVSPLPGTTRDAIEVRAELGGVAFTLVDTAGLRETTDPVEAIGIVRARDRATSADLVLLLGDGGEVVPSVSAPEVWHVTSKCDTRGPQTPNHFAISARTGEGLTDLVSALADFGRAFAERGAGAVLSRPRHTAVYREVADAIDAALVLPAFDPPELAAEHLRHAATALSRISGRVGVEDILEEVFARFCIGK